MDVTESEADDSFKNRGADGRTVLRARGLAQDRRGGVSLAGAKWLRRRGHRCRSGSDPDHARALIEIAFLALHGPGGEDGAIQGFLETLGIPYTGSGVRASAIGMHKVATKTQLAAEGIPVPKGTVVLRGTAPSLATYPQHVQLKLPVVVKPASQGSTIGVTIVRKPSQWKEASSSGASVRRRGDGRGVHSWA